jgi:hypothetical protein
MSDLRQPVAHVMIENHTAENQRLSFLDSKLRKRAHGTAGYFSGRSDSRLE